MKGNFRQATKADKLRRASKVAWFISTAMTAFWIWSILKAQGMNPLVTIALTVGISAGFQYVISLTESALFDGSLPAPWSPDWTWEGSLPWLWAGAIVALLVDVMMNLGGVSLFTNKLGATNIGQDQLEMTDEFVSFVAKSATFVIAILFAVGSELLDEFAIYAETGGSRSIQMRAKRMKEFATAQKDLEQMLGRPPADQPRGQTQQNQRPQQDGKTKAERRREFAESKAREEGSGEPFSGKPVDDDLVVER